MRIWVLFLMVVVAGYCADFTLGDGYVWFENENALINCTAVSTELINQQQVCDFKYKGAIPITINSSFVFNAADGIIPKKAWIWQNTSHTIWEPVPTMVNHTLDLSANGTITTTSDECEWGQGATKRRFTDANESVVYCFDGWVNHTTHYTIWSVWEEDVSTQVIRYWPDWVEITSLFTVSQFSSYKVGTIEASWTQGQSRKVRFDYETAVGSSGKFDIYFHSGSAAQAKADPSKVKLVLDPWWDSSWTYKAPCHINTTVASSLTNFPAYCTVDTATLIGAGKMKSACEDIRVLNSSETGELDYEIEACNHTATVVWLRLPTTTVSGNDTVYIYYGNADASDGQNPTSLWSAYEGVWHFDDDSGNATDSLGKNHLPPIIGGSGQINYGIESNLGKGIELKMGGANTNYARFSKANVIDLPQGSANMTWTWWMNVTNAKVAGAAFLRLGDYATNEQIYVNYLISPTVLRSGGYSTITQTTVSYAPSDSWQFFALNSSTGTSQTFWKNGSLAGTWNADVNNIQSDWLDIGGNSEGVNDRTNITITELRIRNGSSSVDWIMAEYAQTSSMGEEETQGGGEITNVTSCRDISANGTYVMTQNITASAYSCINILADNVSFDCSNFSLIGDGGATTKFGIWMAGANINIENCDITAFATGIYANRSATNSSILTTKITNASAYALHLHNSSRINVTNLTISASENGVYSQGANLSKIQDAHIFDISTYGIHVDMSALNLEINLSNILLDAALGDLQNHTRFSAWDINPSFTGEYAFSYATSPSPPETYVALPRALEFNVIAGSAYINNFSMRYEDADLTLAGEATLDIWRYDASWSERNATHETGTNTLSLINDGTATYTYAILGLPYTLTLDLADDYETAEQTLTATLTSHIGDITAYNASVYYNHTLIDTYEVSGISSASVAPTFDVVAPLVDSNSSIPYNISFQFITVSGQASGSDTGTQTVFVWYDGTGYGSDWGSGIEAGRSGALTTFPNMPDNATRNVTIYSAAFGFSACSQIYANGSVVNASLSACNSSISTSTPTTYTISASHLYAPGLIMQDYFINSTLVLTFTHTAESTSQKTLPIHIPQNVSREYFVWLVNSTNGSINGASNISTILNVTFKDEQTDGRINASVAYLVIDAAFADGSTKQYILEYTGELDEVWVRGHPDSATFNLTSTETYAKTGYLTRFRYMLNAETPFNETQDVNVYLLNLSSASYGIIEVVNGLNYVSGAYVRILKFFPSLGVYLQTDERITNSYGEAVAYIDPEAYYKFTVLDIYGNTLYTSPQPELFVLESGIFRITLDISDSLDVSFISPYAVASCYGNATTNSIIFSYSDATGLTSDIFFSAWRITNVSDNVSVVSKVCDYNISAASGSYVCSLGAGENLTQYEYYCEVQRSASPTQSIYSAFINFVAQIVINDWLFISLIFIVGLGAASLHPAAGVILVGVGLASLRFLGVINLELGAIVSLLVAAGIIGWMIAPGDHNG